MLRLAVAPGVLLLSLIGSPVSALAQDAPSLSQKVQPYIACLNRLSERAMQSRSRYFSWVNAKKGPTGKERIVYGLYTIYDTKPCEQGAAKAAQQPPSSPELEKAGADYAAAAVALEPLLKEADDYYDQGNYKDDKMAKGRELHPKLVSAFERFSAADGVLRAQVDAIDDQVQRERLTAIEKAEGKNARYLVIDLMIKAKALSRAEQVDIRNFDLPKVNAAIAAFEQAVKDLDKYGTENAGKGAGSIFISSAKSFLTTGKELMRRVRDKVPYSTGDKMLLGQAGAGWMVNGSPPRLIRDYNALVGAFNSGPNI